MYLCIVYWNFKNLHTTLSNRRVEGISIPLFQFWCGRGDDRFLKKFNTEMCGDRPRGGSKGVIPCFRKLALGGASWYLCVLGLSASTALQEWDSCPWLPSSCQKASTPRSLKICEGSLPRFDI